MNPSVYFYQEKADTYNLYIGEYDTLHGLNLLDPEALIQSLQVGASSFRKLGWATEKDIPICKTIGDLITFFEEEGEIDLIHFEVEMVDDTVLRTHDDGECSFTFKQKREVIRVLKTVSPLPYQDKLMAKLFDNPSKYIAIDNLGKISYYHTLEQYHKTT